MSVVLRRLCLLLPVLTAPGWLRLVCANSGSYWLMLPAVFRGLLVSTCFHKENQLRRLHGRRS